MAAKNKQRMRQFMQSQNVQQESFRASGSAPQPATVNNVWKKISEQEFEAGATVTSSPMATNAPVQFPPNNNNNNDAWNTQINGEGDTVWNTAEADEPTTTTVEAVQQQQAQFNEDLFNTAESEVPPEMMTSGPVNVDDNEPEVQEEYNENLYNTVESELPADMMTTGPVNVDDNNAVQNNQPEADNGGWDNAGGWQTETQWNTANAEEANGNNEPVEAEVEVHHQDVNDGWQEDNNQPETNAGNVNGWGECQPETNADHANGWGEDQQPETITDNVNANGWGEDQQPETKADNNVNGWGEEQTQTDWNTANEEDPAADNNEAPTDAGNVNVNGWGEEQVQNDWNTANDEDPAAVNDNNENVEEEQNNDGWTNENNNNWGTTNDQEEWNTAETEVAAANPEPEPEMETLREATENQEGAADIEDIYYDDEFNANLQNDPNMRLVTADEVDLLEIDNNDLQFPHRPCLTTRGMFCL